MAREITDILADLTEQVVGTARPLQMAALYRALRRLTFEDFDVLVREMTMQQLGLAPVEPPEGWNPHKSRAYKILITQARLFASIP